MDDARLARAPAKLLCAFDAARGVTIHRFDPGQCRCRCGEKIIRKPIKKDRLKFGQSEDSDFI